MSPIRRTTIVKRVIRAIEKTDFRFDGEMDGKHHLWRKTFEFDDHEIDVEILFNYNTRSKQVFPGNRDNPPEWEVETYIVGIAEYFVYHSQVGKKTDFELIDAIMEQMPLSIIEALENKGRESKTTY